MRARLKKQDDHAQTPVTGTPVQAKSLTHLRPMENSLHSTQIPPTEAQQSQQLQEEQGFNFAEMPIFAGGAEGAAPKIQPKLIQSDRSKNITQQPVQRAKTGASLSQGAQGKQQLLSHEPTDGVQQSSIPIIQRKLTNRTRSKLTPDQIKHANRIRKAQGLALLPLKAAQQLNLNNVEEAIESAPVANQPVANQPVPSQQIAQAPQSDAKRSGSNFQVVHDYSWIKESFKQLKSWDKVKKEFGSNEKTEKTMWQLFDFRQWYVDSLISVLRDTYPGLIAKSVGSQDPTSDYDITISTPGSGQDVEAINWFNEQVRKEFGVEPGTVFDTNLYAKDYLKVEENIDDAAKSEQKSDQDLDQPDGEFGTMASLSQDVAALIKQRRYMKQVEWDQYVEEVVSGIKDPEQQKLIRHQYEEADSIYQVAAYELLGEVKKENINREETKKIEQHTKLGQQEEESLQKVENPKLRDEIRKQLLGTEELKAITHVNSDLVLRNSNKLYLERMTKVRQLQETIRKLGTGEPTKVEPLKAQVQQILGEACFYAAEAYHSEGAVKHIVAGVQGSKNPEQKVAIMNSIKPEHFLQSFNEQLGDFLKDLSHYAEEGNGKIFYRSSKYLYRLFLAVAELRQYKFNDLPSLEIESKSANELANDIDSKLVAIRKGKVNFANDALKDQAAINAMNEILGVQTASDLKVKILKMAQEFNVKVRSQMTEVTAAAPNTSKEYFKNIQ